jgi:hypothetical protein
MMSQGKKKNKDMESIDKTSVVSALLSQMEDAWTKDMEALVANPPRPALNKLAILDRVRRGE